MSNRLILIIWGSGAVTAFLILLSYSMSSPRNASDCPPCNCAPPARRPLPEHNAYKECKLRWDYECPLPDPNTLRTHPHIVEKYEKMHSMEWQNHAPKYVQFWNHCAEHTPPPFAPFFTEDNGTLRFPLMDRVALFCLVSSVQPRRIIEIGAGESTKAFRLAIEYVQNSFDQSYDPAHTVIEPFWAPIVPPGPTLIESTLQEADWTMFQSLKENDVLFIDSSHVLQPFGDTLAEFLFILPSLSPGVIVHIHDIFLPWDYPHSSWGLRPYAEQWLLALMLSSPRPAWDVVWPSAFARRELSKNISTLPPGAPPYTFNAASMWIKKIGA